MEASALHSAAQSLQSNPVSVDVLALIADAVICTDEEGSILFFNRAAEQSFGYSAEEVLGKDVELLLPQRYQAQHALSVRSFAVGKNGTNRLMGNQREVWGRRKNGEEFPSEAIVSRHSVDGKMILTVVHRDIAERKEMENQREAIARELDHRIGNMISVVSSLVSLSAKSAESIGDLAQSLQDRLRALAATQALLRQERNGKITLNELLLAELALYRSGDGSNVIIEGDPVVLCATALQPLALVFHELATNSAKYGAFKAPGGRVTITSECVSDGDEHLFLIEWCETGGPPVKPPSRQGFGSALIEQMIRRALRAEVSMDYRPEGLVCRMTFPRSRVEESCET
ncbi:PAS domain S-box protein [Qipengyuania sp. SM2507]